MKVKKDTSEDGPYRDLTRRAAEEMRGGYRAIAQAAGIGANPESGRVTLQHWVEGRKDKAGRYYIPYLAAEYRKKLLAYLREKYWGDHPHASYLHRLEKMVAWSRKHDPANVEPLRRIMADVEADRAGDVRWDIASSEGNAVWEERLRSYQDL